MRSERRCCLIRVSCARIRASNLTAPTMPPKLRSVPRRSFSMSSALACKSWRLVSNMRRFWLASVFTCTGRYRPQHLGTNYFGVVLPSCPTYGVGDAESYKGALRRKRFQPIHAGRSDRALVMEDTGRNKGAVR